MERWIISCNLKYYDVISAFSDLQKLDWQQSNMKMKTGDEVYIYVGPPYKKVMYRCRINKVCLKNMEIDASAYVINGEPFENYGNYMELELIEVFDDDRYSLDRLRLKGMKGNVQGPRRAYSFFE